jgi:hypothetical protein
MNDMLNTYYGLAVRALPKQDCSKQHTLNTLLLAVHLPWYRAENGHAICYNTDSARICGAFQYFGIVGRI